MSETAIVQEVRLALSKLGLRIFRNQVGALRDKHDRLVTFGLCPGSSDLIGWRSVLVTPDMVGTRVAVFAAVEVKTVVGRVSSPQQNFLDAVHDAGGIAILARDPGQALAALSLPRSAP